jgi:hypothetical protein
MDVFNNNAFSTIELTAAINKAVYVPGRIRDLGLFNEDGITTTVAAVEEINGTLGLIPTQSREAPVNLNQSPKRKARAFNVPHLPLQDLVLAQSVQNVRQFGTSNQLAAAAQIVAGKIQNMRQKHELTLEYHRLGAIKGTILDADGTTTIYNLFTEFGITQSTLAFVFGTTTTDVRGKCVAVRRLIEDALGLESYDHIHALCGKTFFDNLVSHPTTVEAFKYQEGRVLRADLGKNGSTFEYGGIVFEEYSRSFAGTAAVGDSDAHFFPVGVPDLFITRYAPANNVEAANTIGQPFYAMQEPLPLKRGITVYTESNPLNLCTRPAVLVKGTVA